MSRHAPAPWATPGQRPVRWHAALPKLAAMR